MSEGYTPAEDLLPEDEYDDEYEQTKDENIEMEKRDSWEQTQDGFAKPPEEETSFVDLPEAPGTLESLAKQEQIKSFYKYLEDNGYTVDRNAQLRYKALFRINSYKALFITYNGNEIRLSQVNNPNEFLSPKSIISRYNKLYGKGGTHLVRGVLGITNFDNPKSTFLIDPLLARARETIDSTNSSPERQENIEMQTIEKVEADLNTFLETSNQTELALGPEGSLPHRELAGLDRSLRNMRTTVLKITSDREVKKATLRQLKDETSKVAYDEDGEVQFSEDLQEKQREIKTLEEEIEVLDSVIRKYDNKFRSQFQRIKQTIDKMLNQDMTLGERIQTLFREQGLTITSVVTALGLAIGMIINSILSAAKFIVPPAPTPKPTPPAPTPKPEPTPPAPKPPAPTPGIKGWIKEQLRNIANLLLKLADKMLIALPGIIGSVVSFVLKAASTAVGFISEHLWLLVVALVGFLYNYVQSLSLSQPSLSQSPYYNRSKSNTKKRKK